MFEPSVKPQSPRAIAAKRPPARRAFTGLAGSPLARVVADPTPPLTDAKRQKLSRERRGDAGKKQDAERKAAERAASAPERWEAILSKMGLSLERGIHAGKGKLVTGGYNSAKLEAVRTVLDPETGLALREGDTGKVKTQGAGSKHDGFDLDAGENSSSQIVFDKWGGEHVGRAATPTFRATLNNGHDEIVEDLVANLFETIAASKTIIDDDGNLVSEGHSEFFICFLCSKRVWPISQAQGPWLAVPWHRDRNRHVEDAHGDLIEQEVKRRRRAQKHLAASGRKTLEREGWKRLTNGDWVKS